MNIDVARNLSDDLDAKYGTMTKIAAIIIKLLAI